MTAGQANLAELETRLGYRFQQPALLRQALIHSSYAFENPAAGENNERLEFLGDAVLNLVVSDFLLTAYPGAQEGQLTRWRAGLVNSRSLAAVAQKLRLGTFLCLGRGEEQQGGRQKPSVLADALEAVIGAVFLDGGLQAVQQVVAALLGDKIRQLPWEAAEADYKSRLQELLQKQTRQMPTYEIVQTQGPPHDRQFTVAVRLGLETLALGSGKSKKEAAQKAAQAALQLLANVGSSPET